MCQLFLKTQAVEVDMVAVEMIEEAEVVTDVMIVVAEEAAIEEDDKLSDLNLQ